MSIACKWNWHNTGHQVWYDKSTYETLKTTYPLYFYDDFVGSAGGSVFDNTQIWLQNTVTANATSAIVADSANGQFLLHIATDDEAEDAWLYHNDNLTFDVGNGLIFETRINMAVAPGTGVRGVAGM